MEDVDGLSVAIDRTGEPLSAGAMKLLTAIEWARAGKPASHLSLPPRETGHRREMILWLQAHPGSGWFYVSGDNFYFGAAGDAAAFRRWVSAAQPVG